MREGDSDSVITNHVIILDVIEFYLIWFDLI